jgi:hypothetical protein
MDAPRNGCSRKYSVMAPARPAGAAALWRARVQRRREEEGEEARPTTQRCAVFVCVSERGWFKGKKGAQG